MGSRGARGRQLRTARPRDSARTLCGPRRESCAASRVPPGSCLSGSAFQIRLDRARVPQPRDQLRRSRGVKRRVATWRETLAERGMLTSWLLGSQRASRSVGTCSGDQSLPVYTFTSLPSASMIAVRRLCVMSRASLSARATDTPNRDANPDPHRRSRRSGRSSWSGRRRGSSRV